MAEARAFAALQVEAGEIHMRCLAELEGLQAGIGIEREVLRLDLIEHGPPAGRLRHLDELPDEARPGRTRADRIEERDP